ncbi:hypothetical protein P3S67_010975 [Capsicum chacoense]
MEGSTTIGVDCHGQCIKKSNRYIWHWKEGEILETIAMSVQSDISYDDFVNLIISYFGINFQPKELIISYMHNFFKNQRVLPFKLTDQVQLRAYLSNSSRPMLKVYVVEKTRENENQNVEEELQQYIFDDRLDGLDMNIPDDDQTPMPVDATNTVGSSSRSTQSDNLQNDGIDFFNRMSFKDKKELSTTLFISCLEKDFRIMKVINLSKVFFYKCANLNCKWWLKAVKYLSSDRFIIHKHEKYHTCGSDHISGQYPQATSKVLGEYFKNRFPNGKDPSTGVMANQLLSELGILVYYWKVYTAIGIAKDLIRGIHEYGYAVLDAYHYMLESTNPKSKTELHVDENGRFKYFFVSYGAWIQGFRNFRKGIAVDGTFLRSRYNGVLLAAVAQDV